MPLLHCTSLSQSHAIWFLLPLLDQLGRMAGASFSQSHFSLSWGQPETGEWEKLMVQFYQERGHFADTQVGSRSAIGVLLTSPLLCRPSSRLIGYQVLSVSRISWFSCSFTFPTVCPKSSPSTASPYRAPCHTRLFTRPFLYPDILVSPLLSRRQNSNVSKTVNFT